VTHGSNITQAPINAAHCSSGFFRFQPSVPFLPGHKPMGLFRKMVTDR